MSWRLCTHLSVALIVLAALLITGAAPPAVAGSPRASAHLKLVHPGILSVGSDTTYSSYGGIGCQSSRYIHRG